MMLPAAYTADHRTSLVAAHDNTRQDVASLAIPAGASAQVSPENDMYMIYNSSSKFS
jgi:hypothetical protein